MALTLICGPFRPVLEEGFVARLRENPPGVGRRVGVVTASRGMGERLQRLLALDHGLSFFNLRFHTLHGFSMDVLQRAGGLLPQVNNDDFFHESLVEQILRDQGVSEDRANALAGAHRATLRDLVEAGVDGSSFREHFDDLSVPGATGLSRLLSLADLYRERLQQLKRVSSSDLDRLAQDALEKDDALLSVYDSLI